MLKIRRIIQKIMTNETLYKSLKQLDFDSLFILKSAGWAFDLNQKNLLLRILDHA